MTWSPHLTLGEAKRRFIHRLVDAREKLRCPVCGQNAQLNKRMVHSSLAKALIDLYRESGRDYGHVPTIAPKAREFCTLKHWGLIEEELTKRPDGGRAGYWRLTAGGVAFVHGGLHIPKSAYIFDDRVHHFEGPNVSIHDCLNARFDYRELMSA